MNVVREKLSWITEIFLKQIHSNLCHLFYCRLKEKKKKLYHIPKSSSRQNIKGQKVN